MLASSLLSMDKRIITYDKIGDLSAPALHGYIPTKNAIYIPYRFPLLNHELAHIIEMRDFVRLTKIDWGMRVFGRIRRTDMLYRASDKGFFAGMSREIRVKAIERRLSGLGEPTQILSDGWLYDADNRLPFGRFDTFVHLSDWMNNLYQKTFCAWSGERVVAEWTRRLDFLRNWMETR
jgi:hypothetical protein